MGSEEQELRYLHDELARVGARHGGALPGRQDPDGPDVEGSRAEVTAQDNALHGRDREQLRQPGPTEGGEEQEQHPAVKKGGSRTPGGSSAPFCFWGSLCCSQAQWSQFIPWGTPDRVIGQS